MMQPPSHVLVRTGVYHASNEATIGLGPLGSWRVAIEGKWYNQGDGESVRVVFERLRIKPVGVLGAKLPEWLPQVRGAQISAATSRIPEASPTSSKGDHGRGHERHDRRDQERRGLGDALRGRGLSVGNGEEQRQHFLVREEGRLLARPCVTDDFITS